MEGQYRLFSLRMRPHPTRASERPTRGLRGETSVREAARAGDQPGGSALTRTEPRRARADSDQGGRGGQPPATWDLGSSCRGTEGRGLGSTEGSRPSSQLALRRETWRGFDQMFGLRSAGHTEDKLCVRDLGGPSQRARPPSPQCT